MISSKQNPIVKQIRKLATKKERKKANAYVIEGPHLVEEAILSRAPIQCIFVTEETKNPLYEAYTVEIISTEVAVYISRTEATQRVFAIVALPNQNSMEPLSERLLILDAVQDPGNLGTIIRTADALGYTQVILGKGTVDPYNDKTLRAMQGSQFHMSLIEWDLVQALPNLKQEGYYISATALSPQSIPLEKSTITKHKKWALVVGNEGKGVCEEVLSLADEQLIIPIHGRAESLNVAVATAIILYQLSISV